MKTLQEWVILANNVFNNKYEYLSKYKKDNKYHFLEIKCKIHGIFHKKIQNHIIKKQGCPSCTKISVLSNSIFFNRIKHIHGDKYNYDLVEYKNLNTKINIICKEHGEFLQTPKNHMKGQNCPKCINLDRDSFIKKSIKIHDNKYNYDNCIFISSTTKINILCLEHDEFLQKPHDHINGKGCYKCSNKIRTTSDFIEKANLIHGKIYDYSKVNYINSKNKIIIICNIHGEFLQKSNDHLSGKCGCPKCALGNYSKACIRWLNYISIKDNINIQHAENGGEKVIMYKNKKYKLDGYCNKTNTAYEFAGDFFHGNPLLYNQEDINPICKKKYGYLYNKTIDKYDIIKKLGYNLIIIWENEFYTLEKQNT
jgi:hypothetical protein